MMPTRKYNNQNWLPSIFNDFFDNEWLTRANATAPAINVIESDKDYKVEVAATGAETLLGIVCSQHNDKQCYRLVTFETGVEVVQSGQALIKGI